LPALGAGGLLHPSRRPVTASPPPDCENAAFAGEGVTLKGWRCRGQGRRRGTIIYLHGIADNRTSSEGVVRRFTPRGFDVIAYDSRAHGESEGAACTYGFFEKRDLHRVADTIASGSIVLMGSSLGAAVALQEAADDPRVTAIVAAEIFSDLRTVATHRAPFVFTSNAIDRAFRLAERQGNFSVDAVSPAAEAARIRVPVLLIHGAEDTDTPPAHSQRIFAALAGPKRLIVVPGGHHNQSLSGPVWNDVEQWLDRVVPVEPR
jgi:pimeloyl-ACP methyl ester carboxylesterase